MVKLYNFHLAAISVRPLLLHPAPAASTALGWDSVFGLADFWPSHSCDCHERKRQEWQTPVWSPQPNDTIVLFLHAQCWYCIAKLMPSYSTVSWIALLRIFLGQVSQFFSCIWYMTFLFNCTHSRLGDSSPPLVTSPWSFISGPGKNSGCFVLPCPALSLKLWSILNTYCNHLCNPDPRYHALIPPTPHGNNALHKASQILHSL